MADYSFTHNLIDTSVIDESIEIRWRALNFLVDAMLAGGWSCAGSSIDGTAGTAYSSTPNGVNRWSGKEVAEVIQLDATIWIVLEYGSGGPQVALTLDFNTAAVDLVYAKKRFESGGNWRNSGSVSVAQRPVDVTSSPAPDREIPLAGNPPIFLSPRFGECLYHCMVRDDGGAAFMVVEYPGASRENVHVLGFARLLSSSDADTNPAVTMATSQVNFESFADSPFYPFIYGRHVDGTLVKYRIARILTFLQDLFEGQIPTEDYFTGAGTIGPLIVWSVETNPMFSRGTIADLTRSMGDWGHRDPINGGTYIKFGDFAWPWDSTDLGGTPRIANFLGMDAEPAPPGSGGDGVVDGAFWQGQENI